MTDKKPDVVCICPTCEKKHGITKKDAERICVHAGVVEDFEKFLKKKKSKAGITRGQSELLSQIIKKFKKLKKKYKVDKTNKSKSKSGLSPLTIDTIERLRTYDKDKTQNNKKLEKTKSSNKMAK